jgi:hypothetical protein
VLPSDAAVLASGVAAMALPEVAVALGSDLASADAANADADAAEAAVVKGGGERQNPRSATTGALKLPRRGSNAPSSLPRSPS